MSKPSDPIGRPDDKTAAIPQTASGGARTDDVYAAPLDDVGDFRFDARVADVFENMINRSVPGYGVFLELLGVVTEQYAQADTRCYDLGCSLGASTLVIRQHLQVPGCEIIGVDNSPAMIERCRNNIARDASMTPVRLLLDDLSAVRIENASLVAMNFTLQFIAPSQRDELMGRIAAQLNPGGALFLAEKIELRQASDQAFFTKIHEAFKRSKGYTDLEVAQKRSALENVMIPDTIGRHTDRLERAGFASVHLLARCLNFVALLAVKA